jgi:hypothetical protein
MLKPATIPEQRVRAVGRVVVNFQYLETIVVGLIWIVVGPDENIGQRITACVPFAKLCELLTSLFRYHVREPPMVEKFERLMARARDVNTNRNRIVHSWWSIDLVSGELSRLKPKAKGAQYDSENIDADALAISIGNLADDFATFIDELYKAKLISRRPGVHLDSF